MERLREGQAAASGRPGGTKPFPKYFPVALLLICIRCWAELKK